MFYSWMKYSHGRLPMNENAKAYYRIVNKTTLTLIWLFFSAGYSSASDRPRGILLSPRTEMPSRIFIADPFCTIDSLWFNEEILCDEQNLVHVCYILVGDTADIKIRISPNSGATWVNAYEGWFTSLLHATGDIGKNVLPGIHCFDWLMSTDFPNREGNGWIIEVSAYRQGFVSNFAYGDLENFVFTGNDGYVDTDSGYFVLTIPFWWRNGRLMYRTGMFFDTVEVEFDMKIVNGGGFYSGCLGSDGMSVIFATTVNPPLSLGGSIGILYSGGIGVEFDIHENGTECDFPDDHIGISVDEDCYEAVPLPMTQRRFPYCLNGSGWHHVYIDYRYPRWKVWFDDSLYIDTIVT